MYDDEVIFHAECFFIITVIKYTRRKEKRKKEKRTYIDTVSLLRSRPPPKNKRVDGAKIGQLAPLWYYGKNGRMEQEH